jgi:hypothetical protein
VAAFVGWLRPFLPLQILTESFAEDDVWRAMPGFAELLHAGFGLEVEADKNFTPLLYFVGLKRGMRP